MFCCISNRPPQNPVVGQPSGCLFERRLIEKYIAENGRCPITGQPLSLSDLLPLQSGAASGGAAAHVTTHSPLRCTAGIPGLLETLHNEWDAMILEQFMLRQQLTQTQQELAHALYQYDASCRVIATLTEERDQLQSRLEAVGAGLQAPAERDANDTENSDEAEDLPLPDNVLGAMDEFEAKRRQQRKKRQAPATQPTPAQISEFVEYSVVEIEGALAARSSADEGDVACAPATSCISVSPDGNTAVVAIAGNSGDFAVAAMDTREAGKCTTGFGHSHAIRYVDARFDEGSQLVDVLSGADDATVRYWRQREGVLHCCHTFKQHTSPIVSASFFCGGQLLLSASDDGLITVCDPERMEVLCAGHLPGGSGQTTAGPVAAVTACAVHPYGSLAAIGTGSGEMLVWSTKQMAIDTVVKLPDARNVASSIAFNGDCFHLAVGTTRGEALVWDLRRVDVPILTISPPAGKRRVGRGHANSAVVAFDAYGNYLSVASEVVQVFDWNSGTPSADGGSAIEPLVTLSSHTKPVTGVGFSSDATRIVSSSMDGTIRSYCLS